MHIVHFNQDYNDVSHAANESLAVLGAFFEVL